jgi:hypothetical protein
LSYFVFDPRKLRGDWLIYIIMSSSVKIQTNDNLHAEDRHGFPFVHIETDFKIPSGRSNQLNYLNILRDIGSLLEIQHWTGARLIVWVFVWNGDFAVTLLLHGIDCGMIRLWATVTIHR